MASSSFWQGKCVLITGASSGIGWALAEHLARLGARLGLIARRKDRLAELSGHIESLGRKAAFAVADVTDPEQVEDAVGVLEHALGLTDVLIANAGMHKRAPGAVFSGSCARAIFDVNVNGVINVIDSVLPSMVDRRSGHIVTIASIAAMLGLPEAGAYCASKAALVTLMQGLRVDLHRFGVRVTTICPGFVDTPLISYHSRKELLFLLTPQTAAERIARAIALGKREYWFPRRMWLLARLGRMLPYAVYQKVCDLFPRRYLSDTSES